MIQKIIFTLKMLLLMFLFSISIDTTITHPVFLFAAETEILYIRSDIKTINGLEVESPFLMQPSTEEFRMTSFKSFRIHGSCPADAKPDVVSAAKHDAFKCLLRSFGARSIRNQSVSDDNGIHDESVLSYEGCIKTPYTILSQGFNHKNKSFEIEMEVLFAPLAYPDAWSFHYFKKKLYDTLKNMISMFL